MKTALVAVLVLLAVTSPLLAQKPCGLSLSGQVLDLQSLKPLALAQITFKDTTVTTLTDSAGFFSLKNLCAGSYQLVITHGQCKPHYQQLRLYENSQPLTIYLSDHTQELPEAQIIRKKEIFYTPPKRQLSQVQTLDEARAPELRTLKTGENVIKPMVRGFSGNRVSTYLGEVRLQDQQWGTDHGLSLALYPDAILNLNQSAQSFGQIKVEGNDAFIPKKQLFSQAFSNGRGGQLGFLHNFRLLKSKESDKPSLALGYRFLANGHGDQQAANYLLSNTGSQAYNAQIDVALKVPQRNFRLNFMASYDAKNLAVLRASHVGNLSDFNNALNATEPLVQTPFTYQLKNPRQATKHFIASTTALLSQLAGNQKGRLKLNYSYQNNQRQEFEARRGGNENPALNLRLQSHQLGATYQQEGWRPQDYFTLALNQHFNINTNIPGTGFEPILPNYNSYNTSLQTSYHWLLGHNHGPQVAKTSRLNLNLGGTWQNTLAQYFERRTLQKERFTFPAAAAQISYTTQKAKGNQKEINSATHLQLTQRAPAVNELLISGVHHGTASIEEGNLNLGVETKLELNHRHSWQGPKYKLQTTAYTQYVNNYIFMAPQARPRLTIRGAFPVFTFNQTNAFLAGAEVEGVYHLSKYLKYTGNANFIYAEDLASNSALPLIPPFEVYQQLRYAKNLSSTWQNAYVSLGHRYVGRQIRFNPTLDLATPPPDYSLLDASIGISLKKKYQYNFTLGVQNLGNQSYRNYLNRFRYFTDEAGINFFINCSIKF